jgi:hypothetical protein
MEQIKQCEIKVVDYKTEYIAIGAYDDNIEVGEEKSGELNCEYAIIKVDDNLIEALNEIKDESNWGWVDRHMYTHSLARLISTEFLLFNCSISFFGDNPDLENRTELYKSFFPINNCEKIVNLDNLEGNFDDKIRHLCGTSAKYEKSHVKLESGECIPSAFYHPLYSLISFRYGPDSHTDYRTFPMHIDSLIDFITK